MADRRSVRNGLAVLFAAGVFAGLVPGGASAADSGLTVTTTIDGRPVTPSNDRHPVPLHPKKETTVNVKVHNDSGEAVSVRTVRIEGRAVGLAFFAYDTSVGLDVPAGTSDSTSFVLDLAGLDGQATGLMPGSVKLLDAGRHEIASQSIVTDVRGSLWSVYGVFGLAIAGLTGIALARAILELAGQRTSPNRFWRAVRFAMPGVGIGLIVVFTLSATRLFAPNPDRWWPIVLITSLVGFALGYLTPTPDESELEKDEDRQAAGEAARVSAATATTENLRTVT